MQSLLQQQKDFLSQLHTIKTFAKSGKVDSIELFIADCIESLKSTSLIVSQITNPTILAMLLFFVAKAKERKVGFIVRSQLNFADFNFSTYKITRLFSHIILNTIEILGNSSSEVRLIELNFEQVSSRYCFSIWNNGPPLFDSGNGPFIGYNQNSGLRLSVLNEMVMELNGDMAVCSSKTGTEIKIWLSTRLPNDNEICL
jgi:sensor histidine kinase regulating citrate/malate metabolism